MVFSEKCPDDVKFIFTDVRNGNMKLEHFIDIGSKLPPSIITTHLNIINNQGIESIDLSRRIYRKDGMELPIYRLSTGERIFLVATVSAYTNTPVFFSRILEQLSKEVLDRFLLAFHSMIALSFTIVSDIMKRGGIEGMLKLVSGLNTIGKTRYLESLYLSDISHIDYIEYDDNKIRSQPKRRSVEVEDNSDSGVLEVSDLLCRCGDYILLDEVDTLVHPADKHLLYSIIKDISQTAIVVAVTHDIEMTSYGDKYYTVDCDSLVELTEEEYRKLV